MAEAECVTLAGGRRLAYARYGAPGGTPVFYFHGGLSSRLDIAFANDLCRDAEIDLIAPDRPGIGASGLQPHRTLRDWPADVGALADALHIARFSVLGWSGGGPYVLACLQHLGARIASAAIVAGMAPLDAPRRLRELGMAADRLLFPLAQKAPALAGATLHLARRVPAALLYRSLLRSASRSDRAVLARLSPRQATDFFYEALGRGTAGTVMDYRILGADWALEWNGLGPVTLWQGQDDAFVPPSHANALARRLPQAALNLVPAQGHFLLHDMAAEVFSALLKDAK